MINHAGFTSFLTRLLLPDGGYVLSFAAVYIDESWSHQGAKSLVLAGYVLHAERISIFESKWARMLAKYGLDAFHMVDCAHGAEAFKSLTKEARIAAETEAIEIIRNETAIGFTVSISNTEYSELLKPVESEGATSPYTIGLTACLAMVVQWIRKTEYVGEVAYVFEAGHRDQNYANNGLAKLFENPDIKKASCYSSHTFGVKNKFVPLQAADILAWLWGSYVRDRHAGKPFRKDLTALLRPHDVTKELDYPGELAAISKKISEQG